MKNMKFEKKAFPGMGNVYSFFLGTKHIASNGNVFVNTLSNGMTPPTGDKMFSLQTDDNRLTAYKHLKVDDMFYIKNTAPLTEKPEIEVEDWYVCRK